jgi:hypothetical protein
MVYALEADHGGVVGKVRVAGAKVGDWEDISVGVCPHGTCLYIADIGDNGGVRDHITVYRVAEPEPTAQATGPVEAFHATYPDGPQDAEALFVTAQGQLFIITKGRAGSTAVYGFPANASGQTRLERMHTLSLASEPSAPKITDAEASADGHWVALRTHDFVHFYRTTDLISGTPREAFHADVRSLHEPQGEGVALSAAGDVYLVGESANVGTFARLTCAFPR